MSDVDWVVCGWFTPDYRPWWDNLRTELDANGAPYDFVEVAKQSGGWESNTMRKPAQVKAAMQRHPDKTIIFLDVDCSVPGGLEGLSDLANVSGDVAFHVRGRWGRSGRDKIAARSGTMLFKANAAAREFVETWIDVSRQAPRYAVDQGSLAVALGRGNVSVTLLDQRYCARPKDNCANPVILHDSASRVMAKTSLITKLLSSISSPRLPVAS